MKKHILLGMMVVIMLFSFALPVSANWSPNITGGGGSLGNGTAGNVWRQGQDGVRFSFVNKITGVAVTTPVDITDGNLSGYTVYNFQGNGAKNKTHYKNGGGLSLQAGNYTYYDPYTALPQIVGSGANINSVIARFTDKGTIKGIVQKYIFAQGNTLGYSDWTNLYNHLVGGNYKIMIEPIAYFYYNSKFYAMTATEAAKYNTQVSNALHSKMGALTNYALPVSIMLTSSDLFWYDSGVYAQRNNSNFRFSTYYDGYTNGDSAIINNGVGVGMITIAPSSYQTALPDMVISSLTANRSNYTAGDTVTITAVVKNQGIAPTGSTSYTRLSSNNSRMAASNKSTSALYVGGTQTLSWTYTAPTVSSTTNITFTASADNTGIITESSETNNTKTLTITVRPKVSTQPDLIVSSLTTNKSSYTAGETITVTAIIKNQGTGTTGSTGYTRLSTTHGSMAANNKSTSVLAPNGTQTLKWTYTVPGVASATSVTLTAAADYTNAIAESNESNNIRTASFTVNPAPKYPDLIISSLTTDKSSYTTGETITVTATVKNSGSATTGSTSYTRMATNNSSMVAGNKSTSALAVNDTQTLTWTYTAPTVSAATNVALTTTADYTGLVAESNESNNIASHSITITPPQTKLRVDAEDQQYYTNNTVITPVNITSDQDVLPTDNGEVRFTFYDKNGEVYDTVTMEDVVCPAGEEQLTWAKWQTPDTPQTMTCENTWEANGETATKTITIRIVDRTESEPPDPGMNDTNDGFILPQLLTDTTTPANSWTVYEYVNGEFHEVTYTAMLTAELSIAPHESVATADHANKIMKSGYGIKATAITTMIVKKNGNVLGCEDVTAANTVTLYFPEFSYQTYWRIMEPTVYEGAESTFELPTNRFSSYDYKIHYTPIWYPDGLYKVYGTATEAYTPAGKLSAPITDTVTINGSLWDDWHRPS